MKGWEWAGTSPLWGLRFSGEPLALTVNNQPIEGHFEFVMRTGAQEAAFTLLGVTDDRKLVYRAELGKTRIVYTPSTQIYEVLLPSGSINFNAAGQLTTVSDGGGQQLTYEYASFAGKVRLAAIRHSGGRAITLTYTQSGYLQTAATPARLQPTYSLTTGGQLREVRIGGVTQASFRYDTEGRLQEVMGPDGKTLAKADYDIYKRAHQVAKGTRDISPQTQAFDLGARKSTVTASNGFEQTLYYDDAFRPLTGTDALNRASHYRYESTFGPSRHMDAKGHQTDLSYDALGNLNRITNAQGQSLRAMYNAGHQPY
ncbi:hypothetical protein AT251_19645 [Enterovibrio nigricans]|nr:RHS repeat protein [Enterovibrio nigricans]PKF49330.1 hypothetical protein AT251_19645 [Enterovibrio nigricans]